MYDELPSKAETKKDNKDNMDKNNKEDMKKNNKENAKESNKQNAKEDQVEQEKSDYTIVDQSNIIEHSIIIQNGSTKWLDYEREDTLQNINLKVRCGELIAIVGQVGAGKSSLLNVILKELGLQEGSIQVC